MELEQIVELIDRVSASELDSFCLEQNGMRLSLKKKQPRKQTDPETQSTLVQLQKQSESPQEQSRCHRWSLQEQSPQKQSIQKR